VRFRKREKKRDAPGIAADEFRSLLRHWASGVTVVTTKRRGGIHGMTASSFCSVSLNPPLVLVCVDRRNRTHEHIHEQGVFAIHFLAEGQEELSRRCAGQRGEIGNQLLDVPYHEGQIGAPILEDCLAHLECQTVYEYEGGDHTIFVGEIVASSAHSDRRPLLYFQGEYVRLGDA
jgi:flavin reductase (DIM6/NTAB) family NADH-FMN oxidoreductase RutF